jgi:predicted membrane channel-forming protein YqfA (hemolysin III family)
MPLLAQSAVDKMKTLPPDVWLKIGIVILAIIVTVFIFRRVMKVNKMIASVIVFVVGTIMFFSWVYNRNEPKFLTPIVEKIAPFFPTAGAYDAKQQTGPKGTR